MKTATVRELRNRYTSVLDWIEAGEEIIITRRGKAVARLVPEPETHDLPVDWSASPAVMRNRSGDKRLGAAESSTLLHESSGSW